MTKFSELPEQPSCICNAKTLRITFFKLCVAQPRRLIIPSVLVQGLHAGLSLISHLINIDMFFPSLDLQFPV